MNLTSTKRMENNIAELEISVGPEELKAATDRVFKRKVGGITVPGFRRGKAPRQIIERMYGESIFMEDAVNELYPKAYGEAVEEAGIEPVDRADIEVLTLGKDEGFTFRAKVTVKPEVAVRDYKGVAVEKSEPFVEDAEVDGEIERLRNRNARILTVEDRPARNDDEVVINFEGFVDGEPFEGGKAEGHSLTLGSGSFIDTFEAQIAGHSTGEEFDVNVTFPGEYHAEELAGKPALFKVKLCEIKGKELPEADDEFAKDVSEFDTLDELRADIAQKSLEAKRQRADDEFEGALMGSVIAGMEADIPACMIESRIDEMVRDFEYRLSSQGMKLNMYLQYTGMDEEKLRESFRESSERHVKIRLALEKIAELENLAATDEDIAAEYEKIATDYKMDADKVRAMVSEKDLSGDIKTTKALNFVRDNAVVTEKKPEQAPTEEKAPAKPKKSAAKKSTPKINAEE